MMPMWEFVLKYWVEFAFGLVAAGLVAAYRKMAVKIQSNRDTEKPSQTE